MGERSKLWRNDLPVGSPTPDWPLMVGLNRIQGWRAWRKFGFNGAVGASFEDIISNGGTFPTVTTTETMDIVSDSSADDVGGTGATSVILEGLDASGVEQSETVTLNGTSAVTSVLSYSMLHRCVVHGAGTALSNVGNITVTNTTSGQTLAYVLADTGSTLQLFYEVPAGHYLRLDRINLGVASGDSLTIELRIKNNGAWTTLWKMESNESMASFALGHGIWLPPGTQLKTRGKKVTGGGTGACSAALNGYLVEEGWYNAT